MGKVVETALKVFVATVLIVTGIGFLTPAFSGVSFWAAMTTKIGFLGGLSAVGVATLSAVGTLVQGLLSKSPDSISQNFGAKVSARGAAVPRQIIYGRTRVGATITHIETSGTDNNRLSFVAVIAGHECESLDQVIVNDEILTTTTTGGFQVATNSKFTNTDNDNAFANGRLVRFLFVNGSQTTSNATVVANSNLTTSDKFVSCAYVFMQCVFDPEKFGGGLPNVSFIVKGKKCFDPRDSSTAWTDNPALIARDYITDTVYGLKAKSSEVLDTAALGGFISAANTCDSSESPTTAATTQAATSSVLVRVAKGDSLLIGVGDRVTGTGISGTVKVIGKRPLNLTEAQITLDTAVTVGNGVTLTFSQPQYVANGFTDFQGTGSNILSGILSSCSGRISFINGKFCMFVGATVTPDMTIGDDDVLAPFRIITKSNGAESYNTAKAVYVDGAQDYVATDSPVYTSATHLANDTPTGESSANYRNQLEMQLPFTTDVAHAQRLVKQNLLYSRQDTTISTIVPIRYMQLQPHDYVNVTNTRLGFNNKLFEVMALNIEPQGDQENSILVCNIQLKEIDGSVYNFLATDYIDPEDVAVDDGDIGDLSLDPPTGLSLASDIQSEGQTLKVNVVASWTNLVSDRVQGTEVAYKQSTDSDYTGDITVGKGVSKAIIPNLVIGNTYNVKVRHFDINGINSAYTSAVNITISDPTTIGPPTSFTASGDGDGPVGGILLSWTNPNNNELKDIKIYRHTSNFTPTDDTYLNQVIPATRPNQNQLAFQSILDGLSAGVTYFFALRAVSTLGVHSNFTSVVSASFRFGKEDIGLNNVTNHTQVKSDLSNFSVESDLFEITSSELRGKTPIKNDQITISLSGTTLGLNNAGSGTQTLSNANVGLSNVTNHAQVKDDLSNLSITSADFEVSGGSLAAKNALKNAQISIAADGSLSNAGGGQVTATGLGAVKTDLTNAPNGIKNDQVTLAKSGSGVLSLTNGNAATVSFDNDDVGLGNVTNHAQVKDDLSNLTINSSDLEVSSGSLQAKDALKNSQISIAADGTLSGAGGGQVTASGVGAIQTDLGNAPTTIINSNTTKADVGLSNVTNHAQIKSDGSNAPDILKNDQITLSLSGTTLGLNNAGSGTQTLSKTNVGLSDLNSLESGAGTKLSGIETNATFGAVLGASGTGNLLDENDNNLTDAIIITSQGTSNDTNNVNSVAKADVTSAITGTQTNVASLVSGLASGSQSVNANVLNAGQINTSLLKLDELFLPTEGTATSGQTVNFFSTMTQVSLGSLGDGAGFYMGTISVEITDAQSDRIRGASFHIDLKSGSTTVYTKYWPIGIKEGNQYYDAGDAFGHSADLPVMHLEFAYFHTSNTALNLFVNADSNDTITTCLVKARAVRFGAETVTFNPTSVAGASVPASTETTFAAVTVSGFTVTKTVNLSGNSTALISVNSGSFVNSSIPAISANQTFQVKMTSSATAGAVRTATVEIGGTAITFSLTTQGTYTPTYSGGGGSGSAGGGFESTTQLN